MRHAIEDFERQVRALGDLPVPGLIARIEQLKTAVSDSALDKKGLLPSTTLWPGPAAPADTATALKTELDKASNVLQGLLIVLRSGIEVVLRRVGRDAALPAIKQLDALVPDITGPEGVADKVAKLRPAPAAGREPRAARV